MALADQSWYIESAFGTKRSSASELNFRREPLRHGGFSAFPLEPTDLVRCRRFSVAIAVVLSVAIDGPPGFPAVPVVQPRN